MPTGLATRRLISIFHAISLLRDAEYIVFCPLIFDAFSPPPLSILITMLRFSRCFRLFAIRFSSFSRRRLPLSAFRHFRHYARFLCHYFHATDCLPYSSPVDLSRFRCSPIFVAATIAVRPLRFFYAIIYCFLFHYD